MLMGKLGSEERWKNCYVLVFGDIDSWSLEALKYFCLLLIEMFFDDWFIGLNSRNLFQKYLNQIIFTTIKMFTN